MSRIGGTVRFEGYRDIEMSGILERSNEDEEEGDVTTESVDGQINNM